MRICVTEAKSENVNANVNVTLIKKVIHLPSPSRDKLLSWIQKRRVCREKLHHHIRICCKPFIHKVRVVEGNVVSNDDIQSHARPQQPSLFR